MSQTQTSPRAVEERVPSHIVVSDPAEDGAREAVRMHEATPLSGNPAQVAQAQKVVGNAFEESGSTTTPRSAQKRQDFSHEKANKRDTKIGDYMLGTTLGEGEFGKVKLGWKKDGVQVAVKLMRRDKLDTEARLSKVMREIDILKRLNHPNIVKLHETVKTDRHIAIILEYASGGELFDHILHERYLKDPGARRLFSQLISGVGYLHQHGIVHRDLKLENLLLDRNNNIIITDFGFANTFDPLDELGDKIEAKLHRRSFVKRHKLDEVSPTTGFRKGDLMATSCGSPCYAAPELVVSDGIYTGRKVDVWSCGVILYAMLAGYLPFDDDPANPDGDNINLLYKYIVSAPLVFPEHVTPHARDLLRRILVPDPRNRADLFEVARHSWLSDYFHVVEKFTSRSLHPDTQMAAASAAMAMQGGQSAGIGRSSSVREGSKPHAQSTSLGGLINKPGKVSRSPDVDLSQKSARDAKRRTVQIEYVAPQSQTTRGDHIHPDADLAAARAGSPRVKGRSEIPVPVQSPAPSSKSQRPGKEPPRAISDSTAFNLAGPSSSTIRPVTTQGAISSSKLPQRGSYGQPAAATVAAETAQGRFSQPPPSRQNAALSQEALARPQTSRRPTEEAVKQSNRSSQVYPDDSNDKSQRRNSALSNFSDRLFGRSNSRTRPETATREKSDRHYPPSSTKDRRYPPSSTRPVVDIDNAARPSTESSRRSFGFSRKSLDVNRDPARRSSKRFSLIPRLGSSHGKSETSRPQTADTTVTMRPYTAGAFDGAASQQFRTQAAQAQLPVQTQTSQPPVQTQTSQPPPSRTIPQYNYNRHSTYEPAYGHTPINTYAEGGATQTSQKQQQSSRILSGSSQIPRPETHAGYQTTANSRMSTSYSTVPQQSGSQGVSVEKGYNKQQKPSAAGRVMDFFKRKRHDRMSMA